MPEKLLIDFLARFFADEEFRCGLLYKEETTMTQFGLDKAQKETLFSFDREKILKRIGDELETKIHLARLRKDVLGQIGEAKPDLAYQEGAIHMHGIDPLQVPRNTPVEIELRGQGFDANPTVTFAHLNGQDVANGVLVRTSCDADAYQRVHVRATLPTAGKWRVRAQNPGDPNMYEATDQITVS
jgi:hypothetical protein